MENEKNIIRNKAPVDRRKRVKRLKVIIVTIVLALLILPSLCCMFLLLKVNSMEKQIEILTKMHKSEYALYSENSDNFLNEIIVYAAENEMAKSSVTIGTSVTEEKESKQSLENSDMQTENSKDQIEQKKVYLTFDDGPSQYTDDILNVLKKYNVKATFFVIGKKDDESKEIYRRIVAEGHTLGMHSYSHKYQIIYDSIDNFSKDFTKLSDLLYETTGIRPKYYRFPGGSSNMVSKLPMTEFISYLKGENIIYYDWNVENGDATGKKYSVKQLVSNVLKGVSKHTNSIVLMHDTQKKETTVKSLSKLIEQLEADNYLILPIDDNDIPIQHIKSESVVK